MLLNKILRRWEAIFQPDSLFPSLRSLITTGLRQTAAIQSLANYRPSSLLPFAYPIESSSGNERAFTKQLRSELALNLETTDDGPVAWIAGSVVRAGAEPHGLGGQCAGAELRRRDGLIENQRGRETILVIDLKSVGRRASNITPIEGNVCARRKARVSSRREQGRRRQCSARGWIHG